MKRKLYVICIALALCLCTCISDFAFPQHASGSAAYAASSASSLSKPEIKAKSSSFDLSLSDGEEITKEIHIPKFLYAPIEKGEIIGKIIYKSNGYKIAEKEVFADEYCGFLEIEEDISLKSKIEKFIKGILK